MKKFIFLVFLLSIMGVTILLSLKNSTKPYNDEIKYYHEPADPPIIKTTPTGKWQQIFYDDFTGTELDQRKWNALEREDNPNQELQYYAPENVKVVDNQVKLIAKKERKGSKKYTSGQIETKGKFSFLYGRVEIRMKYPKGKGLFPALWLLPVRTETGLPEIDIMEAIGQEPFRIHMTNHWQEGKRKRVATHFYDTSKPSQFHTYALEWEPDEIRWYIDGKLRRKTNKGVPQQRMYLIMNLAVGGIWPGPPNRRTIFPAEMAIDYVKVYQKKGDPTS